MYRIDQLEKEWLRRLWLPKPALYTEDHPAFDHSPFLFKEDEAKFQNIIDVHGWEGAEIVAKLFPLKLLYPNLVFDQAYTEKHHNAYFKERFGIENALAEDFDPEESRIPKGQEGSGRWTAEGGGNAEKNEGFLEEKVKKFQDDFRSLAEKNGENTLVSEIERHCEHFIEENFERNTTDFFDLSKNLTETDSADLKDLLRENPLKLLSKGMRAKNIAAQLAVSLLEHILKKGLRLSGKSSLRFPIRNNLAPWLEREGKWMGKKGSSNTVRIMEPSEDPYQSALNFVRSVRKYKAKQGIASKELSDNSHYGNDMLRIEFDDGTYISVRKAGDSGRQTPDDQVTVGIKGSQFGKNQRKFKFPEIVKE